MSENSEMPWYRFSLAELFILVTAAGVTFAALTAFGVDGLLERIEGTLILLAPFEILYHAWRFWKKHCED